MKPRRLAGIGSIGATLALLATSAGAGSLTVTATFIPLLILESDFESAFDGWSDVVGE